jgi:hypothetical protein
MVRQVALLFWCIWHNRNKKIWNYSIQPPSQVNRMAFVVWNEWFTIHHLQHHSVVPVQDPRPVRWEKPGWGWIKWNVDVAFVAGSGCLLYGPLFSWYWWAVCGWLAPMTAICFLCIGRWSLSTITCYERAIHRGFGWVQFESDFK